MNTAEIARCVDGELVGDPDLSISGIGPVKDLPDGMVSFLTGSGTDLSGVSPNSCVLIPNSDSREFDFTVIRVSNPKFSFAKIAGYFLKAGEKSGHSASSVIGAGAVIKAEYIGPNVTIGNNASIETGCEIHSGAFIGDDVSIGKDTVIHPNAVIYSGSRIGSNCIVHAGAVIGAEGFGYVTEGDEVIKFPQIGTVLIEDSVEIGANTCIDRGALGVTRIGSHTKIDNLVQIAHNVDIGCRVLIASLVGISGSVVIEDDVVIAGQVGIADHVVIKKGAVLGARSAVFPGKIVRAGVWAGTPVRKLDDYKIENALVRSLPRIKKEIEELKNKLS